MAVDPYIRNPTFTDFKESVRVASTASINISAPPTAIDGVTLAYGDRILLKDQAVGADNGIYIYLTNAIQRTAGGISGQISSGSLIPVEEGTVNGTKVFLLVTENPITVGSTALVFEEFGSADAATLGGELPTYYIDRQNHSGSPSGNVDFDGFRAVNAADPTNPQDYATKQYVDDNIGGGGASLAANNVWTATNEYEAQVTIDGLTGGFVTILGNTGVNTQLSGDIQVTAMSGADVAYSSLVNGDPYYRTVIDIDGKIVWGDGANPSDTNLYRDGVGQLKTDDNFYTDGSLNTSSIEIASNIIFNTPGSIQQKNSGFGNNIYQAGQAGDPYVLGRFTWTPDGSISWGDGTLAHDVSISRSAANTLQLGAGDQIQVQQDPVANDDLARKSYVDDSAFDPADNQVITGTWDFSNLTTFNGGIDAGSLTVENVADPVNPQDAATRQYVDGLAFDPADNQAITGNWDFTNLVDLNGGVTSGGSALSTIGGGVVAYKSTTGAVEVVRTLGHNTFQSAATGHTTPTFAVSSTGTIGFGSGTSGIDTFIGRGAAGVVSIENLSVTDISLTDDLSLIGAGSKIQFESVIGGATIVYASLVFGAVTFASHAVTASGIHSWGDGTVATDTNLYRSAANTLKTDDSFIVGTSLTVEGNTVLGNAASDTIGFYGETPVVQAAAIAAPATQTGAYVQTDVQSIVDAVNSIRTALADIGITA